MFRYMDKEEKRYKMTDMEQTNAAEPVATYGCIHTNVTSSSKREVRSDVSRAITGDMLLSRLRPRIKSLFE